ncbi:Galactose transporter [Wickerhamomyces ciferrii]|uniref:Galactose transporter n=1 Tax=Wickerhamomyces ciferrii (strain ATCC 14091 / BCRC 22168 / CBS 111 / JCM 3599 / NBRC 0793 / NRRL Y-1031 F-60-10) TaxID=1206466 RepID=K0K927_WICCF|nr:Galactose transporter [Wickerhamomyces ciferrii]CCH41380.1 Galactose transporter [Wickerhamomyces ciferrii]
MSSKLGKVGDFRDSEVRIDPEDFELHDVTDQRPPLYSLNSDVEMLAGERRRRGSRFDDGESESSSDDEGIEEIESPNLLQVDLKLLLSFKKVIFLCTIISFSGFLFGWDTGVIGGMIQMKSFLKTLGHEKLNEDTNEIEYQLESYQTGLMVSSYHIGCIFGGFTIARLSTTLGRKMPILIAMWTYIFGITIQITSCISGKWYQFLIGRFISGLCIGSVAVLTPMFISETAPTAIRGSCTSLYQLINCSAIVGGGCAVYLAKELYTNVAEWVVPLSVGIVAALVTCVGILSAPESARYLISKGDYDNARKSLKRVDNPDIEGTLSLFQEKIMMDEEAAKNVTFIKIFSKRYRRRVFIGLLMMLFQQMSGIDYFFYYGTTLFKFAGANDPYVTFIILATINFFGTMPGVYFVEKYGRKTALLCGAVGCFIPLFVFSLVGTLKIDKTATDPDVNKIPGIIMIVFTCFFFVSFAPTWGASVSVLVSELYPLHIKSHAVAFSTAFNWGSNFFIGFCTPIITDRIGYTYGFIFAGFMFVAYFVILFLVPETQGVSLEEIENLFEKN